MNNPGRIKSLLCSMVFSADDQKWITGASDPISLAGIKRNLRFGNVPGAGPQVESFLIDKHLNRNEELKLFYRAFAVHGLDRPINSCCKLLFFWVKTKSEALLTRVSAWSCFRPDVICKHVHPGERISRPKNKKIQTARKWDNRETSRFVLRSKSLLWRLFRTCEIKIFKINESL